MPLSTPKQYILSADYILTQCTKQELQIPNPQASQGHEHRLILENSALVINNGMISEIGKKDELIKKYSNYELINCANTLLMPGLINAHCHASMTIFRGLADDLPLMEWLTKHIFPKEAQLNAEIVEIGALLGCAEMLRTGTTTFCDMYLLEDAVCEAADKMGIKILAGEVLFSFPSPAYANEDQAFDLLEAQLAKWSNKSKIRFIVSPHSVYTTSQKLLERCKSFAELHSLPLNIHLSETKHESAECLKLHGKRPVEYCHSLGLLSANTTIAHAVDLTEAEIALLAQQKVKIAHNPKSNLKLNSGIAPVPQMLASNICVGLGTDGPASNNSLNMFSEMNVAALIHKVNNNDPSTLPASQVLDMATRGSAEALHWDNIGRLAPNYAADIVGIDLNSINLQPLHNPVSQLVYASTGHEVSFTIIDGEFVYKNGQYKIDLKELQKEISKISTWIKKHS